MKKISHILIMFMVLFISCTPEEGNNEQQEPRPTEPAEQVD